MTALGPQLTSPLSAEPVCRSFAMTVCANDFALLDLGEDLGPRALAQASADIEILFPEVIELKDDRVAFAAVHTGVALEVLEELRHPLSPDPHASLMCLLDVFRLVALVVLFPVGGAAGFAVGIGAVRDTVPGESGGGFEGAAARASVHAEDCRQNLGQGRDG